jgi:hypothetical protein
MSRAHPLWSVPRIVGELGKLDIDVAKSTSEAVLPFLENCLLKAGLPVDTPQERKRFHDFRRTTARDLSHAGSPDHIAWSIMGHKTRSIYDRYSIVVRRDSSNCIAVQAA